MLTKVCKRCQRTLEASEYYYYKKRSGKYGLDSTCKECRGFSFGKPQKKVTQKNAKSGYKICTKCNIEYLANANNFFRSNRGKYGLDSICKQCKTKHNKEIKEKTEKASWKAWYENNKSRLIIKASKYYHDNNEMVRVARNNRYKNNESVKKYYKEYSVKYRQENKDKFISWKHNRRSKANKLISTFTAEQWEECLKYFNYKDAYTGEDMDIITQDHVIPVDKGGNYCKSNIVPCDMKINSSKGSRDFETWYRKQQYFDEKRMEKIYKWIGYDSKTKTQQLALC